MSRFLDSLPRLVIEEQIQRLERAFPGKHPSLDGFADELKRATEGWHQPEFVAAIDAAIRAERTFPRIATILKHRPEAERRSVTVGHPHTCRQCGIDSYLAGYETADGRLFGRYRCGCEPGAPGWYTPRAQAWTDPRSEAAA